MIRRCGRGSFSCGRSILGRQSAQPSLNRVLPNYFLFQALRSHLACPVSFRLSKPNYTIFSFAIVSLDPNLLAHLNTWHLLESKAMAGNFVGTAPLWNRCCFEGIDFNRKSEREPLFLAKCSENLGQ